MKNLIEGVIKLLITKETDYALRILRSLSKGGRISSSEICTQELIPQQFAYKILGKLAKANLIESIRGPSGGSVLIADLNQITLYDLMKMVEGSDFLSPCTNPEYQCSWRNQHHSVCNVHNRLMHIQEKLNEELRKQSLHQIIFGEEA